MLWKYLVCRWFFHFSLPKFFASSNVSNFFAAKSKSRNSVCFIEVFFGQHARCYFLSS